LIRSATGIAQRVEEYLAQFAKLALLVS